MPKRPKSPARAAFETCRRLLREDHEALRAYVSLLPPSLMEHIEISVPAAEAVYERLCYGKESGENLFIDYLFIDWRENGAQHASYTALYPAFAATTGPRLWPTPTMLRGVINERGYYKVPR